MKNCTTQLLFSLSLVYMVYSSSETARNKRSLLLDNVLHHRFKWLNTHKDTEKRSAFDALDLDELFSDPVFQDMDSGDNIDRFDYNEMEFNDFPDFADLPPDEKDEMSNVIPGAQGPFEFQPKQVDHKSNSPYNYNNAVASPPFQENAYAHFVAESMMDEFMQFLDLKAMGILDQCLEAAQKR